MIFPVNKTAQSKYAFELDTIGQFRHIPIPDFQTARIIARHINHVRNARQEPSVFAWQVAAHAIQFFLMDQVIRNFSDQNIDAQMAAAREFILNIQSDYLKEIRGMIHDDDGLEDQNESIIISPAIESDYPFIKEIVLRNLILRNPASSEFEELATYLDRNEIKDVKRKRQNIDKAVKVYLHRCTQGIDLFNLLTVPFKTTDHYVAQLDLIKEKWGPYIGFNNHKLLNVTRYIHEEISHSKQPSPGKGYQFFSAPNKLAFQEQDWMRNVVLVAKNTPVWLGQLAKKYQRPIDRLDQIPDDEFFYLKSFGVNAIWLIGIWERSPASGRIKELYGNAQAIASAYSIYRYSVDQKLGGSEALDSLISQAHSHGFRMGCDMVPNHTGIDSPWVIEHPEWFIDSNKNPKQEFVFNSPNLSSDKRAEIFLEEGYYSQSGAAEVFKYCRKKDPKERYIYHGNDGTSMPWNDTAQLNYLNPDTRSAVLDIIRDVAARFDIIRFDAAMTLTRQHFKRLWFPDEQTSDHIPTREHAVMSQAEFDSQMPDEFWLEVTEDLKSNYTDTLLIAEAFWLMEGFFINQLGMHRVYNSAFMHLLRDEENAQFRIYLNKILETDPLVLERFVNYLTTPDEMSAADQFGTSAKYFGMCTLLATMPGLPMIGHGQMEGFSERYGMDFISALWNETPDESLIADHKQWIFPLFNQRERFSGANNFFLLDVKDDDGVEINDVIAFTNSANEIHSMVLFNNSPEIKKGIVRGSSDRLNPETGIHEKKTLPSCLALGIHSIKGFQFREIRTGDSFQVDWNTISNHGLRIAMKPYQALVYDIKSLRDE